MYCPKVSQKWSGKNRNDRNFLDFAIRHSAFGCSSNKWSVFSTNRQTAWNSSSKQIILYRLTLIEHFNYRIRFYYTGSYIFDFDFVSNLSTAKYCLFHFYWLITTNDENRSFRRWYLIFIYIYLLANKLLFEIRWKWQIHITWEMFYLTGILNSSHSHDFMFLFTFSSLHVRISLHLTSSSHFPLFLFILYFYLTLYVYIVSLYIFLLNYFSHYEYNNILSEWYCNRKCLYSSFHSISE
jgi:hypothetical protein